MSCEVSKELLDKLGKPFFDRVKNMSEQEIDVLKYTAHMLSVYVDNPEEYNKHKSHIIDFSDGLDKESSIA